MNKTIHQKIIDRITNHDYITCVEDYECGDIQYYYYFYFELTNFIKVSPYFCPSRDMKIYVSIGKLGVINELNLNSYLQDWELDDILFRAKSIHGKYIEKELEDNEFINLL